jgi:AcrR family transcriptional regulator
MSADFNQKRREHILEAALEVFAAKGYDKTGMNDIVRASGLSKGGLYWHFKSKEELFAALVKMVFERFGAMFGQMAVDLQTLPPPERLHALLINSNQLAEEIPYSVGLIADFFTQAWQYKSVREALADVYDQCIDPVAATLQEGIDQGYFRPIDARAVATMLAGASDGVVLQSLLVREESLSPANLEMLADVIVHGLMKNG